MGAVQCVAPGHNDSVTEPRLKLPSFTLLSTLQQHNAVNQNRRYQHFLSFVIEMCHFGYKHLKFCNTGKFVVINIIIVNPCLNHTAFPTRNEAVQSLENR